jgi:hypothetical protein
MVMSAGTLRCMIGLTSLGKLASSFGDSDDIVVVDVGESDPGTNETMVLWK